MPTKICNTCKIEKDINEFGKHPGHKDGFRTICKSCKKVTKKLWEEKNKESRSEKARQWREANPDFSKNYRKENADYIRQLSKEYYAANKEKLLKKSRDYENTQLETNPLFKFKTGVRHLLYNAFRRTLEGRYRKSKRTEEMLGCTLMEFAAYIESQFKPGMTFENYGKWHLDHRLALATAKTEEDIIRLNHYTNFQPLWAEENLEKGAKII